MKGKIFTAQEVQAILNKSKVMFREVIKPQPETNMSKNMLSFAEKLLAWSGGSKCPYKVGQKIFCKESFAEILYGDDFEYGFKKRIIYRAEGDFHVIWKPAQHMKQHQSRITLRIKDISVERLQDISEEDAKKEGFKTDYKMLPYGILKKDGSKFFIDNWNATHKKPEEKFEANPWVWKIEFEVVK